MAIPVAHFVSQADHRPHADPPSTGRAPADSDCILTREEGEQLAIAIPMARPVTVAKTNHYSILFRYNPEAIREVQQFLTG